MSSIAEPLSSKTLHGIHTKYIRNAFYDKVSKVCHAYESLMNLPRSVVNINISRLL